MSSKADKLGRGVSFGAAEPVSARRAAIAAATGAPTTGVVPHELPIDAISHNPDNPRETLHGIQEMADTFDSVGQVTAITVATVQAYLEQRAHRAEELDSGRKYVVVDGHRRLAAARLLGWDTIRVMVDDAQVSSDERLLEAAFVANTQRDDMSELEQATALMKLVEFYGSQGKAAKRLGKSQAFISQRLSLLQLSPELQADLNSGARQVKHVRNLASLTPDVQKAKADERAAAEAKPKSAPRRGARQHETHNPVMGSGEEAAAGERAAVVPQPAGPDRAAAASTALAPPTSAPLQDIGEEADVWADPVAMGERLVEAFSPENRRLIAIALMEANDREAAGTPVSA